MSKTIKKIIIICVCVAVALTALSLGGILIFRIDETKAEQIALEKAGGGEIVAREVNNEGLLKEFSYVVKNGDNWYKIEIGGFGQIEEMESGTGDSWRY